MSPRSCAHRGMRPEVIPFGGSTGLGVQGYVDAGGALLAQLPGLAGAVVAVGSGGTMAGLVLADRLPCIPAACLASSGTSRP
jgi:1-aminocyclopropane-1-carboxylate deaminase/D-cysteine desulfhydrase-like pyridoxal-dependent ACC family enzyme